MPELTHRALEAHRQYVSMGRLPAELLRASTRRAWERSHLLGANARLPKAEQLSALETGRLLEQQAWFIEAARPYLRMLSRAAGEDRHAAMLGDAKGIVLETLGDPQTIHGPEPFPNAGALLDERVAGSNGIGTPLAEEGYAELVGPEHFIRGFHPFTCQGIPVKDATGYFAGVVSVSVRRREAAERLHEILVCAAHGVEAELLRRRLEEDVRHVVASGALEEPLVEKLRQDIVQSQAAARIRAEAAARGIARNRLEESMRLLALAERSIAAFRRQATLWQELASNSRGAESAVALGDIAMVVTELMRTEATTKGVELSIVAPERMFVRADRRVLARTLFRALLQAFDQASGGGAVRVEAALAGPERAVIMLDVTPAPGRGASLPLPFRLALSLADAARAGDLEGPMSDEA